jgi:type VI secretion system protein ImpA
MADSLNLEELLVPITEDNPCGESLRWDPVWSEIQQKRKPKADPLGQFAEEPPDWDYVVRQTSTQLATRSKDLQLAAWLVEALTKTEGFPGFQAGLAFVSRLIQTYWEDGLYPRIEDDDLEQRLAPLYWLTDERSGGNLPTILKSTPILPSNGEDELTQLFWEGRIAPKRTEHEEEETFEKRMSEAGRKRAAFDQAAATAPIPQMLAQKECLLQCLQLVKELDADLTERCGAQSPGWSHIETALRSVHDLIHNLLRDRNALPGDGAAPADPGEGGEPDADGRPANSSARSRHEAIQHLSQAAAYFSSAEPHSPVGYLIRRAIRWANMPFEDLLAELLKDGQPLDQVKDVLGLTRNERKEESGSE